MKNQRVLPSVIDELSNSIEKFGISGNRQIFDDELSDIVSKMNHVNVGDENENWEILQENYSKLKYLYGLINLYNLNDDKFTTQLSIFMESIDRITQYYMECITWYNSEFMECSCIYENLCSSLNNNDSIKKMVLVLQAYKQLVPLVESIRSQTHQDILPDDFIETFEPLCKRLKY